MFTVSIIMSVTGLMTFLLTLTYLASSGRLLGEFAVRLTQTFVWLGLSIASVVVCALAIARSTTFNVKLTSSGLYRSRVLPVLWVLGSAGLWLVGLSGCDNIFPGVLMMIR